MKVDLAVSQAKSLLWAARHLQDLLNVAVKTPKPDSTQAMGCFFSAILLRSFAAEVALKSLYAQENGREAEYTHDLLKLFNKLSSTTRHSLNQRFQRIRHSKPECDDTPTSIEQTLAEHRNDFIHWRYYYLPEPQGTRNIELLNLDPAVEAIAEEFLYNLRQ